MSQWTIPLPSATPPEEYPVVFTGSSVKRVVPNLLQLVTGPTIMEQWLLKSFNYRTAAKLNTTEIPKVNPVCTSTLIIFINGDPIWEETQAASMEHIHSSEKIWIAQINYQVQLFNPVAYSRGQSLSGELLSSFTLEGEGKGGVELGYQLKDNEGNLLALPGNLQLESQVLSGHRRL